MKGVVMKGVWYCIGITLSVVVSIITMLILHGDEPYEFTTVYWFGLIGTVIAGTMTIMLIIDIAIKAEKWWKNRRIDPDERCRTWLGQLIQDAMDDKDHWIYDRLYNEEPRLMNHKRHIELRRFVVWHLGADLRRKLPRHDRKIISRKARRLWKYCVRQEQERMSEAAIKKIAESESKDVDQ